MMTPDEWARWGVWRDQFAAVIDPRFYSVEWLQGEVWSGRARFWSSDAGAIVATMKVYPAGGREVHGLVAAGTLDAIRALIPAAESWGRSLGCCVAGIDSRSGWARTLHGDGYRPYQQVLRKEL